MQSKGRSVAAESEIRSGIISNWNAFDYDG
jgi:hypothetical protein